MDWNEEDEQLFQELIKDINKEEKTNFEERTHVKEEKKKKVSIEDVMNNLYQIQKNIQYKETEIGIERLMNEKIKVKNKENKEKENKEENKEKKEKEKEENQKFEREIKEKKEIKYSESKYNSKTEWYEDNLKIFEIENGPIFNEYENFIKKKEEETIKKIISFTNPELASNLFKKV
jgi:hypothetical protein